MRVSRRLPALVGRAHALISNAREARFPAAGRRGEVIVRVLDERGRLSTLDPDVEPGRALAAAGHRVLELVHP